MTFAMEDPVERKPLQIHGNPAALSLPTEPEGPSVILWVDNTTGALLEGGGPPGGGGAHRPGRERRAGGILLFLKNFTFGVQNHRPISL